MRLLCASYTCCFWLLSVIADKISRHTHTRTHARTHARTHPYRHIRHIRLKHTNACVYTHVYTQKQKHARTRILMMHMNIDMCMDTDTHTPTRTHTHDKQTKVELNIYVIIEISRKCVYFLLVIKYQLIFFKIKKLSDSER
jgi:hypothetical protein